MWPINAVAINSQHTAKIWPINTVAINKQNTANIWPVHAVGNKQTNNRSERDLCSCEERKQLQIKPRKNPMGWSCIMYCLELYHYSQELSNPVCSVICAAILSCELPEKHCTKPGPHSFGFPERHWFCSYAWSVQLSKVFLVICGVELDVNKILIYLWLNEAKCNEIDDKYFHEFPSKMV